MTTVRSLFSGIEGFGLGLRMAGLEPDLVDVSEIDPFARRILAARFPAATLIPDVREIDEGVPATGWLTAGFPCQPVSQAGRALAQADERWLWPEVCRVIDLTRPRRVIVENVRGLLHEGRGMGDVLADLARIGYGAQWDLIPARAVGASHLRHRVWIVAYPETAPLGPVFASPPWRFPFPPDPAERDDETRVPRLIRTVPLRRERLTALGNAVVPQVVASVAINIVRAETLEPFSPPRLIPDAWPTRFPPAGALVAGHVFALPTSVPKMARQKVPSRTLGAIRDTDEIVWPTPAASLPNETETVESWEARGLRQRDIGNRPISPPLAIAVQGAERGLWPTPQASDGTGGRIQSDEVRRTGRRASGAKAQRTLADAAAEAQDERIWPSPRVHAGRTTRDAATRPDSRSGPSLGQAAELAAGRLPLEIETLDEAPESWRRLWPTPKAFPSGPDYARLNRDGSGGDDLATAVARDETGRTRDAEKAWATPTARDAKGPSGAGFLERREGSADLAAQAVDAEAEWPTPTAAPWSHGGGGGELVAEIKRSQGEPVGGWSRHGDSPDDPGRSLNPVWVEWLMGYPSGWTDPDTTGGF